MGLGGLLDCTNVITPDLVGITTIGLDHQDILGETLEEIAFQKAGIIKDKVPVVCGNIETVAMSVIEQVAKEKQAPCSAIKRIIPSIIYVQMPNGANDLTMQMLMAR